MKAYVIFRNGEYYNKTRTSGLYETVKGAKLGIKWVCDKQIKYDSRYYSSASNDRKNVYDTLFKEYSNQFKIKELLEGGYVE